MNIKTILKTINSIKRQVGYLYANQAAAITVDTTPTDASNNPVSSNGVFDALAGKADTSALTSHTSNTSNPHSVTAAQVGLGNVTNTSDANKPVSTAQQTALDLKVDKTITVNSQALSSNVTLTKSSIGLANVDNTSDVSKPVSTAQQTALDLKAPLASPTFTGTVAGITATMVGLGNVNNTSDVNKPVSTAQQTAIDAYRTGRTILVTNSAAINTTETIISQLAISANAMVVGSTYKVTAFGTCTSTVANVSTIRIRLGTAGTTSDAVMSTVQATAAASGTNIPFSVVLYITIRTTGSGGTCAGNGYLINTGTTGISATGFTAGTLSTAAAVNTTVANTLSFSYVSAATTTTSTFQMAVIELIK